MIQVETLVNEALDAIGYKRHLGNIYDGSPAARVALDVFGQTRDEMLQALQPDWSQFDAKLVLLKSAPNIVNYSANYADGWLPTYPPIPWLYEYQYPDDCVQPLQIKDQVLFAPVWRPRANPWRLNFDGEMRTLLSNVRNPVLIYVRRVTDPNVWQNDFIALFIAALAKRLQPQLAEMPRANDARGSGQQSAG